jgi:hypothetical protein
MRSYALAAVEAARPKWLPIETAPKDGTLLLVVNDSRIAMAHRITSDLVWYQFVSGVPMLFHPVLAFEPTHWQPLPAAPSQE